MSQDIGMRVGAAGNQAATVVASLASISAVHTAEDIVALHEKLTASFYNNMHDLQTQIEGANTHAVPVGNVIQSNVVQAEFGATPITQQEFDTGDPATEAELDKLTGRIRQLGADNGPVVSQQPTQPAGTVQIVGDQHGPVPTWLPEAMAKDGCTKVYDNRDGLQENPRRPWFKAADGTVFKSGRNQGKPVAYWPPKGN